MGPISSVFRLLDNFLNLNFQAIECCLADVISKWKDTSCSNGREEQWSEEAINDFERLTHASQWKVILTKVKGYTNRPSNSVNSAGEDKESEVLENASDIIRASSVRNVPCIELVDTNSNQDIDIGKQLVSLEHAVYIDGEESTRQEDEGIGINEVFDSSTVKSDIEPVMEEVVQNIVDQSIVHSFNKPSMSNEQKLENS